ncbi:DUF2505 domain-containing protein [Nocardia transvalensis]|uniref:DUF2505 domain-containing protein n=1 Tax=Nocardia transvalensis TaxID=37333 RepID=UPI001894D59B|nr:DUF2505 domain-containing protein [Nocardia transvalensis]MBF6329910.1 DUF2505 domain-containing protein [Nocardia transvalensis]
MSTEVDRTTEYPFSAAAFHDAVLNRAYWEARIAEVDGEDATLDSFESDGATVRLAVSKLIPPERMPDKAALLRPSGVRFEYRESWSALVDGCSEGHMDGRVVGAPITVSADFRLRGDDSRCVLHFAGTVTVHIPVLGKPIEARMIDGVREEAADTACFTEQWLRAHRRDS